MATQPPFATWEDLSRRLPGGLAEEDVPRAEAALDDAAALIRAEAGRTYTETNDDDEVVLVADVPAVFAVINLTAARRELANPEGIVAEDIDGNSIRWANSSTGVYLRKEEVKAIRRAAGRSGLWTLGTTRGPVETPACDRRVDGTDDEFVEVVGSELLPFLPGDATNGLA